MRLVSLNIWGGREYNSLMVFLESQKESTDVLCFQEIFSTTKDYKVRSDVRLNLFQEISIVLSDHIGYFDHVLDAKNAKGKLDPAMGYGLAIFVKKDIPVVDTGSLEIFAPTEQMTSSANHRRTLQYVTIKKRSEYCIGNVHGLHTGAGKEDTPERLIQSQRIRDFFVKQTGKKVLCGDFNLLPNTKSIQLLEKDMVNLISRYNIKTTRSRLYLKDIPFADYTMVSPDIKVRNFTVPYVEASDHLPMILEFD